MESAKKLHTAYKKMYKPDSPDIETYPVYNKLKALHVEYGYNNPVKLTCITENKVFWKLETFDQLAVLENFVDWAKRNNNKASTSGNISVK